MHRASALGMQIAAVESMNLRPIRLLLVGLLLTLMAMGLPAEASAQGRSARMSKSASHRAKGQPKVKSAKDRTGRSRTATTSMLAAKKGTAKWQKRRTQTSSDTGLKDHASRHSTVTPAEYLALGQKNISDGRMLKGGGKHKNARYHIRKLESGSYSMTITNKTGKILSIDTWKSEGAPLTREALEKGLRASGVAAPKNFWNRL